MDKSECYASLKKQQRLNDNKLRAIMNYMTCCHIPYGRTDFVPKGNKVYNEKVRLMLSEYRKRILLDERLVKAIKGLEKEHGVDFLLGRA
jgi:hypothetical protein